MAQRRERDVERHLLVRCRERGFLCLKFTSPGRVGVLDRLVVTPAGIVFVELKSPGRSLRRLQRTAHTKIRRAGGDVHVVASVAGVDALVEQLNP